MLHVRLLGPLQVTDDEGRDLTPPGARERAGLATLAVMSPESLSTERLASELYRERGTTDPRNAVQAMVSRLRRTLGRSAGSVETTANGYRLVDVDLDVDQAERLLRGALATDELGPATDLLDQARALWSGPTLDGLDGELVEAERLRIDGLRHQVEDSLLERRVRLRSGVDGDPDLIGDLEAAVRDEPLREQRWELLMLALYRTGRQADALRAFQRARDLLTEHLGLEPGSGLTDLERRILDHDPTLDRPDEVDEPGPPPGAAPQLPSGTLTVLMCDVDGAVRRWEADPVDTATAIERFRRVWTAAFEAEAGVVVRSIGDGIMAVFHTADRAIRAAARAMAEPGESELTLKAAVHSGPLEPRGDDYRGPVVNRCARLLDLAAGGQILVSGTAAELARGELESTVDPDGPAQVVEGRGEAAAVGLHELGSRWLRDVPDPMAIWQVTGPGLQAVFRPLPSSDQTSLPRLRGPLLGRDDLVRRVSSLVEGEPLVTLLGPGGIGKTSTAVAVGWAALGHRPVTFVDLAHVDDPTAVAERLAEAVAPGHDDDPRAPVDRLADRLASSTELVIVDNAEHLLDAVTEVVDLVLATQLKGSFVITSRQPLGLSDEILVGIPPLDVPVDGDDLRATGRSPSVSLFIERARALQPEFSVADGLLPVVAHICRRLDGIPLAIELAAGRAALLSVEDIAARLDDQLRLLRQVRSRRDRRHHSLEAAVSWSIDQLSPQAREVFDRVSVMAGPFGLDGLEAFLQRCGLENLDALEALDELHNASLVAVEPGGSRFRMLEPIRQYAATELAARGLETESRRAHAVWITDLADEAHRSRTSERARARGRLDAEADQVLAALSWVADSGQVDLAGSLAYPLGWWFLTRDARVGERMLSRLLNLTDRQSDPLGWAQVVLGLGMATAASPRSDVAQQSLDAVAVFDRLDHPDKGLVRLAALFAQTGNDAVEPPDRLLLEADRTIPVDDRFGRALVDLTTMIMKSMLVGLSVDASEEHRADGLDGVDRGRRAAATFRELGERWALGTAIAELGRLHQRLGDLESAEACYLESLELFERDDNHGSHYAMTELAKLAADRGDFGRADRLNTEAMRIAELDGSDGCIALTLAGMAHTAEARGDVERAIALYQEAVDLSGEWSIELGRADWERALERLTP
jgi:predicted ATPase/class 3 adenylate cyclase